MTGKSPQPSHEPPFDPIPDTRHTDQTVEGRNIGDGRGEDAKTTASQTATQTLNEELEDPSSVQRYYVPCEPALGRPLSSWTA